MKFVLLIVRTLNELADKLDVLGQFNYSQRYFACVK